MREQQFLLFGKTYYTYEFPTSFNYFNVHSCVRFDQTICLVEPHLFLCREPRRQAYFLYYRQLRRKRSLT